MSKSCPFRITRRDCPLAKSIQARHYFSWFMAKWSSVQSRNGISSWTWTFKGTWHWLVVIRISKHLLYFWKINLLKSSTYCSGLPPNGNWISLLANHCRSLEKLFLTAARTVKDTDLIAIAKFCSSLKQLDLLGNSYITSEGCCRQVTNLN